MKFCLFFTISALYCVCVAAAPARLTKFTIDNAVAKMAVCNDGSPYMYYGAGGNPNKWVIHVMGGAWCHDIPSCAARWTQANALMSSKAYVPFIDKTGVFDTDPRLNPDYFDATKVYLPYCSSDCFAGDLPPAPERGNWHFRGKRIFLALIQQLLPAGLAKAPNVLFTGCSAGGEAVVANMDFLASLLPPLSPPRNYKAMPDSSWYTYVGHTYAPPITHMKFQDWVMTGARFWRGTSNEACHKALGANGWKCFMGQDVQPYLKTPTMHMMYNEDSAHVYFNGLVPPLDAAKIAYIQSWRANITREFGVVKPPHAVFSPACYHHCVTETPAWWEVRIGNLNIATAWHNFQFAGHSPGVMVDHCAGINCSPGCPKLDSLNALDMLDAESANEHDHNQHGNNTNKAFAAMGLFGCEISAFNALTETTTHTQPANDETDDAQQTHSIRDAHELERRETLETLEADDQVTRTIAETKRFFDRLETENGVAQAATDAVYVYHQKTGRLTGPASDGTFINVTGCSGNGTCYNNPDCNCKAHSPIPRAVYRVGQPQTFKGMNYCRVLMPISGDTCGHSGALMTGGQCNAPVGPEYGLVIPLEAARAKMITGGTLHVEA